MSGVISRLSAMLKGGKISVKELIEAYISRIEAVNPLLNAYVYTTFEEALSKVDSMQKRIAEGASPLAGIPFALKDNICTAGIPTTCCSKILENFRPCYDATVWSKLKAQGAVLLGKTNMDEFAMGSTSESSFYGAPKNPVNTACVTGGSSGGSAAAVKAELAAFALGSDTGGSIRQPASFCGVVGFKPTYGAVSRYGLIAYASSLDQIGPFAQTVEDAAIVYDAIRGKDEHDMTSACGKAGATDLSCDVKNITVGVPEEFFSDGVDEEVKSAIEAAICLFERGGATIRRVHFPDLKTALSAYYVISCAEASSNLGRYDGIRYGYRAESYADIDEMIVKTRSTGFGAEVKRRIMLGTYVLSSGYYDAYYKKACLIRSRIRAAFRELFSGCDILITPASPTTAFHLGKTYSDSTQAYLADICTVPVNIAGLPAVSLPCGVSKDGLPIGMQIIADRMCDSTALACAHYFEREAAVSVPLSSEVAL
ncbi:MAG TPA: Asp-tRNA(Asn)/Glu-tRNA(Gln) amidotransferase subunit GatA [Candidatus Coproplasma excrementigallinarum]|uniref:Glutamyl-tRNA(Gln) amidotransferase subunit A n=1 Tax=Candidatus Coproplasma excrementigallinarum TaxID=2840747 RepID=A0A9D1MK13_9FIRM|nr:Asp-tRNA(Asn)/Glu-tRNA(Gln) amidotransferase subunit GatA [Candidatus Coproplasma excrementigallinarum]